MVKLLLFNIKYLITEGDVKDDFTPFKTKIKELIIVLLISFFISLILIVLTNFFLTLKGIKFPINYTQKSIAYSGILYSLFSYVIYAPVIEELGFRLGLKYSRNNFSIMISCLSYFFLIIIHFSISEYFKSMDSYITNIIIALLFGIVTLFILTFSQKIDSFLTDFWSNHRKQVFYFSVFLFGGFHYFNFELNFKTLLLMPFITLPQTIYGLVFGYIRLKYSIFYSVLSHSLLNMVAFIPTFLDYIK